MNILSPILANRAADVAAADLPEWIQLAPLGEFPIDHAGRRVVQVLDSDACNLMAAAFANRADGPGLLIDYDHFSLDPNRPSEAAGWIKEIQSRSDGLWGRVVWTDQGAMAVRNRRYVFISPTWDQADCREIAPGRIRPARLRSAGLTNEPNLIGIKPIVNRAPEAAKQGEVHMDYKVKLIALLGLPAEATDEQIAEAVAAADKKPAEGEEALANNANAEAVAALTAERDQLQARLAELEQQILETQVEKDLDENKDVIANRAEVKKALMANRASALALLKAMRPATNPTLHNRASAKTPADDQAGAGGQTLVNRQNAAVTAIKNRERCSFRDAWNIARAEQPALFVPGE